MSYRASQRYDKRLCNEGGHEDIEDLVKQLKELQLQQDRIIARIATAKKQSEGQTRTEQKRWHPRDSSEWRVGDKVKITNKVTVPGFRKPTEEDATAHISKIVKTPYETRVHFTTISGLKRWRIDSNLSWVGRSKQN